MAENPTERELVFTRSFKAPPSVVFKAWTDPRHVAQWWGPRGFTNPVCELDVRQGGAIRIDMRGPDGTVYPMTGAYREIVEPERLVFTSAALDEKGRPLFEVLNTVVFAEQNGKTIQTSRARVVTSMAAAAPYLEGMETGWTQSLERLDEHLANDAPGTADREIVTTRVVDAPRERVWKAWTDREQVAQWWGPDGFTNTIHEMDLRPGGVWRYVMHGPDGTDYKNKMIYEEIVEPERLSYLHESGPRFHATATFDEQGGKTTVTTRMLFDTAEQRDRTVKAVGAVEGAKQTLARLAEHVAKTGGR